MQEGVTSCDRLSSVPATGNDKGASEEVTVQTQSPVRGYVLRKARLASSEQGEAIMRQPRQRVPVFWKSSQPAST